MPSLNGELSTLKDIPIWIKEQEQLLLAIFFHVSEDGGGRAVGLPAKAVDIIVLMQKIGGVTTGSARSGLTDTFFGKKAEPSFPTVKQRENRPSPSVLQAEERRSASYAELWSRGAVPEWCPWKKGLRLETGVQMSQQASVLEVGVRSRGKELK